MPAAGFPLPLSSFPLLLLTLPLILLLLLPSLLPLIRKETRERGGKGDGESEGGRDGRQWRGARRRAATVATGKEGDPME